MSILKVKNGNNWDEIPSIKGKSAYQYAVDGGYQGTEQEFAQKLADEYVTDVQINSTSIINNGVANVPFAGEGTKGVIETYYDGGTQAFNGKLLTMSANETKIKAGADNYRPIVPNRQHIATFYGLTKAAGVDMASSRNAVGMYTDAAKVAIQKMLGIYEAPWELIREDTFTNATEADHEITVDGNGNAFELTDVIVLFETPKQDTDSAKGAYGQIKFYPYASAPSTAWATEGGAWTQAANTSAHGIEAMVTQKDNLVFMECTANTTSSNRSGVMKRYNAGFEPYAYNGIIMPSAKAVFWKILITAVTGTGHYKLIGKRKWS